MDWLDIARGARGLVNRIRKREPMGLSADWHLEYLEGGEVIEERRFRNLIVNTGLDLLLDRMFNPGTIQAGVGFLAIGTGATPESPVDVALVTEVVRQATVYTPPTGPGTCVVETTFPAAGGYEPAAITEAGLFDLAAAGSMFSRKTFPAASKQTADTLKVTVTLTISPL